MSELLTAIHDRIEEKVTARNTTFWGVITSYSDKDKACTVTLSNPSGAGRLKLYNLTIPYISRGTFTGDIKEGYIAVINAPMGDFSHAQIVTIKPPDNDYTSKAYLGDQGVPRSSKTPMLSLQHK